jgi:archaemetzincin
MNILLKPIGTIDGSLLEELKLKLRGAFGCPVEIGEALIIPEQAFNRRRGQYLAPAILDILKRNRSNQKDWMLGIIDVDLYAPELNFVFGQAEPATCTAIISLYRLRQELPPDPIIFSSRAAKEAVHEIGHIFGLGHCPKIKCVMHFSNSLHDTDIKDITFCSQCQPKLIQ